MHSFYYKKGANALGAATMAAFGVGIGKLWYDRGGFMLLAFAVLMAIGTAKATLDAMSSDPALRFDHRSLWVRKAWGGLVEIPWRDVHDVALKIHTVRYMGIVPISRTAYVSIACEGGLLGARRWRVSTSGLGMNPSQSAELFAILKQAHIDAVGVAAAAMAAAGGHGWGVSPAKPKPELTAMGFDADAAFARYMASKDEHQPPQTASAVPRPQMPQRPTFGRRVG
jgi:hypothetical protein